MPEPYGNKILTEIHRKANVVTLNSSAGVVLKRKKMHIN